MNCGAGEDSWESLGREGDQTTQNPKGNQLWIFTGRTDAEAPILDHIMQRDNSLKKILMLGKTEERRGRQRMRWLDSITDSKDMNLSKLWERVKAREACMLQSMGLQRVGHNLANEQQEGTERQRITWLRLLLQCAVLCLVTQSCPTLWDRMDCSPPGSSVHRDSPHKNNEVGCHALLQGIFST